MTEAAYILASCNDKNFFPVWMDSSLVSKGLTLNTWVHVAIVWDDGANEIRTYLDGNLVDTNPHSDATIGNYGLYVGSAESDTGHECYCDLSGLRLSLNAKSNGNQFCVSSM